MPTVEQGATIYLIGVVIAAVIVGAFIDEARDDWAGGWMAAALWPVIFAACAIMVIVGGPFWLGRSLRKIARHNLKIEEAHHG